MDPYSDLIGIDGTVTRLPPAFNTQLYFRPHSIEQLHRIFNAPPSFDILMLLQGLEPKIRKTVTSLTQHFAGKLTLLRTNLRDSNTFAVSPQRLTLTRNNPQTCLNCHQSSCESPKNVPFSCTKCPLPARPPLHVFLKADCCCIKEHFELDNQLKNACIAHVEWVEKQLYKGSSSVSETSKLGILNSKAPTNLT